MEDGEGFASVGVSNVGTALMTLLAAESIVPGSKPGYQVCKEIYVSHPLGAKMTETPVKIAQSQEREIKVQCVVEARLKRAFRDEWSALDADATILGVMTLARTYGIASVVVGARGVDPRAPLDPAKLHEYSLFFNVLDPLNTSGSLVLDQDPNSPFYQRPRTVAVAGVEYHPSRAVVVMNEQPVYIAFTASAFGFVGRSVYQRALYPMKTFLQSMITDDMVTKKVGLLVWNAKAPGPIMNNRILGWLGIKRQALKGGVTGNVLTVGLEDVISSLNLQNLEGPARFARDNCLKNIAMAACMPAKLLEQEEMIGGMAEGTEDAKQIARYIDRVRLDMAGLYATFDAIAQRRAWSPAFYETIRNEVKEYKDKPYETAFYEWKNAFTATWPNLLAEPDSEKAKLEDVKLKSAIAVAEVALPAAPDQENKALILEWLQGNVNGNELLFTDKLDLDFDAIRDYEPPQPAQPGTSDEEGVTAEPKPPLPFKSTA
jgi:Protein of unknown function (DUF1073)